MVERNNKNIDNKIDNILLFIMKYKIEILNILDKKGYVYLEDIMKNNNKEDYELLTYPCINNYDLWKTINYNISQKIGLNVRGKQSFNCLSDIRLSVKNFV